LELVAGRPDRRRCRFELEAIPVVLAR